MRTLSLSSNSIHSNPARFMKHYAPKLHIFEADLDPNVCHSQSPLLFWTIVAVGSRKYSKDPTILSLLGPQVITLAQRAIFCRDNTSSTPQAFPLLCIWRMPVDSMYKDFSPMLCWGNVEPYSYHWSTYPRSRARLLSNNSMP